MKSGAHAIRDALATWLERDKDAVLLGESVHSGPTTSGLAERFEGRVHTTPVAERTTLGLAIGMALAGRSVAVEFSSTRSLLAVAEMLADASRFSDTVFSPNLAIRVPIGGEAGSAIDPAVGDLLAALPGIRVRSLHAGTAEAVLADALGEGVQVVLEPRTEYSRRAESVGITGSFDTRVHGSHISVVAWGSAVPAAVASATALAAEGISAQVLDLHTLSPLDPGVSAAVRETGRVLVAHPRSSELAQRILRIALHDAFLYLESPPSDCIADPAAVDRAVRDSVHY